MAAKGKISRERLLCQERLLLDATEAIWAELRRTGIRKSELAERLGVSKAYVTQALDAGRNLTLRTVADFAWALECEPRVFFAPREFDESRPLVRSRLDWQVGGVTRTAGALPISASARYAA